MKSRAVVATATSQPLPRQQQQQQQWLVARGAILLANCCRRRQPSQLPTRDARLYTIMICVHVYKITRQSTYMNMVAVTTKAEEPTTVDIRTG